MDITEFKVIRPPVADDETAIHLVDHIDVPGTKHRTGYLTHLPPSKRSRSIKTTDLPPELGDPSADPLTDHELKNLTTPLERIYHALKATSRSLARADDRLTGAELVEENARHAGRAGIPEDVWTTARDIVMLCLSNAISNALQMHQPEEYVRATELTRLVIVADLLSKGQATLKKLTPGLVFDALNHRSVILSPGASTAGATRSRVKLVKEATIADLHVIRREWACYSLGEVANIRNLMAGESFRLTQKHVKEREETTVREDDRTESEEYEDSNKLASELSQEVNTQLGLAVNGHFNASAQYKTPVATINLGGGANVSLTLQRGERFASKIAREAVSRAVRRVDTRIRETRTDRELTRDEDITRYEVINTGENLHAVYRWVDRVDRYQVFRYPDRLQLEFQLPEPAEYYRSRTVAVANAAAAVDLPPTFEVTPDAIRPDNLISLATTYRASNLPAPPDEKISMTRTVGVDLAKDAMPQGTDGVTNVESVSKEVEIPIPTNYRATSVTYSGHGYPLWGMWRVGSTTIAAWKEGFRSGFAAVSVGDKTIVDWVGGFRHRGDTTDVEYLASYGDNQDKGSVEALQFTTQAGNLDVRSAPYGRAALVIGRDTPGDLRPDPSDPIPLDPGVGLSLRVGVSITGLAGCLVTFLVTCERTEEAYRAWQLTVYDALFTAWSQWKKEYEAAQLRAAVTGATGSDAGSSTRNEQVIREELKRGVISWLLDEANFAGRPALLDDKNPANFHGIDFDKARSDAPTIQFLEQAFEWGNLVYMFYPYYWADDERWGALSTLTANDAEFERFLRAGSARVVVPARPGFTDAVKNWLQFQVPFLDGQLPAIGDPLHVAIDREIRDLTSPWEGGVAEDTWEARVSTTFLYLEEEVTMPIVNDAAVLPWTRNDVYRPPAMCGDDGSDDDSAPGPTDNAPGGESAVHDSDRAPQAPVATSGPGGATDQGLDSTGMEAEKWLL